MRKLKLECEALSVQSFETTAAAAGHGGTVHAAEWQRTVKVVCDQTLLATNPTCCPCTPRGDWP